MAAIVSTDPYSGLLRRLCAYHGLRLDEWRYSAADFSAGLFYLDDTWSDGVRKLEESGYVPGVDGPALYVPSEQDDMPAFMSTCGHDCPCSARLRLLREYRNIGNWAASAGHPVQVHEDATGIVAHMERLVTARMLTFSCEEELDLKLSALGY